MSGYQEVIGSVLPNKDTFLENNMEVNKDPLGVTGGGEATKEEGKGEVKWKPYHKCIIYGKLHSSFCRKDNMTSTVARRAEAEGRSLASRVQKAAAETHQGPTPAAGSEQSQTLHTGRSITPAEEPNAENPC